MVILGLLLVVVLPTARRQGIPLIKALGLVVLLWLTGIFAIWACVRLRIKRRRSHHRSQDEMSAEYPMAQRDESNNIHD